MVKEVVPVSVGSDGQPLLSYRHLFALGACLRVFCMSVAPQNPFAASTEPRVACHCSYGFVVYADASVTDVACAGLNGMRMGERTLTVRRATEVCHPPYCTARVRS